MLIRQDHGIVRSRGVCRHYRAAPIAGTIPERGERPVGVPPRRFACERLVDDEGTVQPEIRLADIAVGIGTIGRECAERDPESSGKERQREREARQVSAWRVRRPTAW